MGKTPGAGERDAVRALLGQVGASPAAAADQGNEKENDKNKEQYLRDRCSARGDAKETQRACYQCYDQKDQCPA